MLPSTMKQFGLRQVLLGLVWMSIAMALITSKHMVLLIIGQCMAGVAVGMVLLFFSDVVDDRPMNDRGLMSSTLNFIGIGLLFLSVQGMILFVTFFFSQVAAEFLQWK